MIIEINKDIDRYQESVAMGLTAKQLLFSIASVVVGGGLVLILYKYVGLTIAAYIAVPIVAPIALGGFYSYNGMSFYELMGKKIHFMFGNKALVYVSTEGDIAIEEWKQDNGITEQGKKVKQLNDENDKNKQEEFEVMKNKMKITIIATIVGIVILVAGALIYKSTR